MLMKQTMNTTKCPKRAWCAFLVALMLAMVPCGLSAHVLQQAKRDNVCESAEMERPRDPHNKRFDKQKFQNELKRYISARVHLTSAESAAFFPLFFEMKEKLHDFRRRADRMLENAEKNATTEAACNRMLNEYASVRSKELKVEADYTKRFKRILSARKVVQVMTAERMFGREHFRRMFGKQPGEKCRR